MCVKRKLQETERLLEYKRDERVEMMETFCVLHHKVNHMIDCWNGDDDHNITKEDLQRFPFGCWVVVSEGVQIKRRKDLPENILVFDTEMEKGSKFGIHKHSDCMEYCDVLEGKFVDIKTNIVYEEGKQAIWGKGIEHIPVALKETKLMVYFK